MEGHLIVCGLGHVGYRIVELLDRLCEPFVVITREIRPEWQDIVKGKAAKFVVGDGRTDTSLRAAGVEKARAILIVTSDELMNIEIAIDAQRLNPKIGVIVRLFDPYLSDRIRREMGVRNVFSPALLTAPVFVAEALGEEMLRAFTIDNCELAVTRLPLTAETSGVGERLHDFCERRDLWPLAVRWHAEKIEASTGEHFDNVLDLATPLEQSALLPGDLRLERPLAPGDELIVAASSIGMERLRHGGYIPLLRAAPPPPSLRARLLAAAMRPLNPVQFLLNTVRQSKLAVRVALASLLSLITVSVAVFHQWLPSHPSWIDSLYFVVSTLTTVGFGDFNLREAPWWLKLYGCLVMLGGAALVAIVFGLITDTIVRTRVDQALGRRLTKLTDHLVVIGLGDVGTRVAEELRRTGRPVVAIERDPQQEGLPTSTDWFQVIIGDASRDSVLTQANVAQARAIIVTTSNDLASLRIAHQAEMLNPNLRSVIRIYDSSLANKLADSLGIDAAVNAAATAASTFVASALREGVEQGFVLGDHLFLLRWLKPEEMLRGGYVGATMQELRQSGLNVLLRRSGTGEFRVTQPVNPSDIAEPGDGLLILEEYYPDQKKCASPQLFFYHDARAL